VVAWPAAGRDELARLRRENKQLRLELQPNQLWVADITFVPTAGDFLYLAVVLDASSRRIVGWSMANHLRAALVIDALGIAIGQRKPGGVLHHSDQGSNIRLWLSASAARRPTCGRPWYRSAMATTTPCARASSPGDQQRMQGPE
jgi:transposase InsO family protein